MPENFFGPETEKEAKQGLLTELFDTDTWMRIPHAKMLRRLSLPGIKERARVLTEKLSDDWKKWPKLLVADFSEDEADESQSIDDEDRFAAVIEARIQKADVLFGEHRPWRKRMDILMLTPDQMTEYGRELDGYFGEKWRQHPQILTCMSDMPAHVAHLDKIFGTSYSWRQYPQLAMQKSATMSSYAEDHTEKYGSDTWKKQATLIATTPRTFNTGLRLLKALGIRDALTEPYILKLLSVTSALKREKANLIRKHLLHHKYVFDFPEDAGLAETVAVRADMSEEARKEEAEEVAEFAKYITDHPRLLQGTKESILEKARQQEQK